MEEFTARFLYFVLALFDEKHKAALEFNGVSSELELRIVYLPCLRWHPKENGFARRARGCCLRLESAGCGP